MRAVTQRLARGLVHRAEQVTQRPARGLVHRAEQRWPGDGVNPMAQRWRQWEDLRPTVHWPDQLALATQSSPQAKNHSKHDLQLAALGRKSCLSSTPLQ